MIQQSLVNDAKLPGSQLLGPDAQEDKSANTVIGNEELKKLKNLLQQRDNEISILFDILLDKNLVAIPVTDLFL